MEPIEWIVMLILAGASIAGMNWWPTTSGQTSNCGSKTYY